MSCFPPAAHRGLGDGIRNDSTGPGGRGHWRSRHPRSVATGGGGGQACATHDSARLATLGRRGEHGSFDRTCTLIEGVSIVRSSWSGDIVAGEGDGFFYRGARLLPDSLSVNGRVGAAVGVGDEPFTAHVRRARHAVAVETDGTTRSTVVVVRRRFVGQGLPDVEVQLLRRSGLPRPRGRGQSDFTDLLLVGTVRSPVPRRPGTRRGPRAGRRAGPRCRPARVRVEVRGRLPTLAGRTRFETLLPARGSWEACLDRAALGGVALAPATAAARRSARDPTQRLA